MRRIFVTDESWTGLIIRIGLGAVMLPHGAQKVLGWFGGPGFSQAMTNFTLHMHIPGFLALLVIIAESFGALGLILGFFTRLAAFGLLCDMLGAIIMVHWPNGWFMNWTGKQAGEGFEYHILVIAICLALMIAGGGRGSVDGALAKRIR